MQIKLSQLVNSEEALVKLLETKLPVKKAYWLSRFVKKISPELQSFNDSKMKLFTELGEIQKDEKTTKIKPENMAKFQDEMVKLLDIEVDIDVEKFDIADLGDALIEPKYITSLDYLFNE